MNSTLRDIGALFLAFVILLVSVFAGSIYVIYVVVVTVGVLVGSVILAFFLAVDEFKSIIVAWYARHS